MGPLLERIDSPDDVKKLQVSELPQLASEVREYILEVVSVNGGHLGAALGAVDLTLALHYCFSTPKDTIVWDVGHQVHAHKILTGRREAFRTFRKPGGLSGFSNKDESVHDAFTTGHGGASISTSLGIAAANKILKHPGKVVAVIGDASWVSGMALEAMNHAGHLKDDLIVVLNDNEMSISPTVGALSKYLNRILTHPVYNHMRKDIEHFMHRIPRVGDRMVDTAKKIDEGLKHLFVPGHIFEEMGFRYFGPLDGHNIEGLVDILDNIRKIHGPVLLHVVTKKGKGYKVAEDNPQKWHASTPFCVETGSVHKTAPVRTYTQVFGEVASELAAADPKIVAITAAMCDGTGLVDFSKKFPDRFFDVGIAEEHGVAFAAGLSKAGLKPLVAIYSTFLQRSHDQILHDVALQDLPVFFCLDRAGLVGEDGATHNGVFDLAYLRKVPGLTLMAPRDGRELEMMLRYGAHHNKGPIAVRYPRGAVAETQGGDLAQRTPADLRQGKAELLREGSDVTLLAAGSMVYTAYEAAELLAREGVQACVINVRFVKPLDEQLILDQARRTPLVVTMEEGNIAGGFGGAVLELLESRSAEIGPARPEVRVLALPDRFIEHGRREDLLAEHGLSAQAVRTTVLTALRERYGRGVSAGRSYREGQTPESRAV
ncbi:MAG: 1-deoxy-D-xylulose-5-phosphate synthase [Candidatus Omnitrophica bacterium]|nr:1-deoxy-D-xylulose-5-phosphate synthase [Candidatus Omnitrophota bacterium]